LTREGVLFHAKHAYMPNSLGYCGPDDRGTILRHLEEGDGTDRIVPTLKEFEAAYPFLKLIARSTGRDVFDYSVPEAYWIGNPLLDKVPVPDLYHFSHRELPRRSEEGVGMAFRALDGGAWPHHTFYVMSTYASSSLADGPSLSNESTGKISRLVDSCRISWGEVTAVKKKALEVRYRPVELQGGRFVLSRPRAKLADYNPEVRPFGAVKPGDQVSIHWDYACEVLNTRQIRNIEKYTALDIASANTLAAKLRN
jgi:Family of unknown function (DUF6390)